MSEFDLVVRGGTVADGTGEALRTADVAVRDGIVVAVGRVDGTARREIDADGALVTPGLVDIHTHYDGQATWTADLTPSVSHGVTTVVMSNCGVGFAPVRPGDHQRLIELMEGVEDIPGTALHEGLPWDWESFPDFLDSLDRRPHDIDVAAQIPHGPLRLFVMGERGAAREPATPDEIAEMGRLAADAIRSGALGFTTSRTLNHRTSRGEPTPTLTAARAELVGIAAAIGATDAGVLQLITDFPDFDDEVGTMRAMVEASGRPLSVSLMQIHARPDAWRDVLAAITTANEDGLVMRAQVATRAIGIVVGLQATINPLAKCPSFAAVAGRPVAEQAALLGDPALRAAILAEYPTATRGLTDNLDRTYVLSDPPAYEPEPSQSVSARAARQGVLPEELLYDLLRSDEGRCLLYVPIINFADGDLRAVAEMLAHPYTVPGLGDGGAHVGIISDGSFPTTLLSHWGRDRTSGPRFAVEWLVRRHTQDTARAVGLLDRGVLAPGYKADINVIDFDALGPCAPRMVYDLPAGGRRLLQPATGYLHTLVSGTAVQSAGDRTGEAPGRLVRGAQPQPTP
jgi:N-acyl-D-aspartate/D-glutamate deacylase